MYFEWKDEYSIGIKEIDEQHKKLFEIGGRIACLVFNNNREDYGDKIVSILAELVEYSQYHFKYEEEHMVLNGYVHQHTHSIQHEYLTERIGNIVDKGLVNNDKEVLMEMVNLIFDWVLKHILKEDMKYKEFLNS